MTVVDGVVEDRVELVEFALRDRVEFVIVALRAADGQTEKGGAKCAHAIEHGFDAELFGIDAALLIDLGVAVETGGDFLVEAGIRQEVAAELFDYELIVREIAVQCGDDPVTVFPNLAGGIDRVAVGISIARDVEPRARPAFAVVRRGEEACDDAAKRGFAASRSCSGGSCRGGRRVVGEERRDLGGRGRETDEIEADAAEQGDAVGLGGRGDRRFFVCEPRENEGVDGVL